MTDTPYKPPGRPPVRIIRQTTPGPTEAQRKERLDEAARNALKTKRKRGKKP